MKYIIFLLLGLSISSWVAKISRQQIKQRIIFKMTATVKEGWAYLGLKVDIGYLKCKEKVQQVFRNSEFTQIFKMNAENRNKNNV